MSKVNKSIDLNLVIGQQQQEIISEWVKHNASGLILVKGSVEEAINTTCLAIVEKLYVIYPFSKIITLERSIKYNLPFGTQIKVPQGKHYYDYMPMLLRHNGKIFYIEKIEVQEDADVVSRLVNLKHLVVSSTDNNSMFKALSTVNTLNVLANNISDSLAS